MEKITTPQIKKLHCLYRDLSIDSKGLIRDFTHGRVNSTAELTKDEAVLLITSLSATDKEQIRRRVIYFLAYTAGIIYGETELDKNLNRVKLNLFLKQNGTVKKDLELMNLDELIRTHKQMEGIVRNSARTKDNKEAKDAVDRLLTELNIAVSGK